MSEAHDGTWRPINQDGRRRMGLRPTENPKLGHSSAHLCCDASVYRLRQELLVSMPCEGKSLSWVFYRKPPSGVKIDPQSAGSRASAGILCDELSIRNKLQRVSLAHLEYRDTKSQDESDVLKFAPRRAIVPRGLGKLRNEWLGLQAACGWNAVP